MKIKRWFLLLFYLLLIASGPIAAFMNTPLTSVVFDKILFTAFLQRNLGTIAFAMLFTQIVLGSEIGSWIRQIGGSAFKYHVSHGLVAYFFMLAHPFMQIVLDVNLRGIFAGLITLLPGRDIFLNFGKLALLFISTAVFAGYFRTKPFLRKNWRKFHILNYLAFIFVGIHSWNLGTDVKSFPFITTYIFGNAVVILIIFQKIYSFIDRKLVGN